LESTTTDSLTKRMAHQAQNPANVSSYIGNRTLGVIRRAYGQPHQSQPKSV